ncbi:MAG: hypothetical protein AAF570_28955, partial [Bacteroidota bacterium]
MLTRISALFILLLPASLLAQKVEFQQLDHGLELATIQSPQKSIVGKSEITVLRIDPEHYDFELVALSEHGGQKRTAKQWC